MDTYQYFRNAVCLCIPPAAAGIAIIPTFRGQMQKSLLQCGDITKKVTFQKGLKGGVKIAPTVAGIVGAQMTLQGWLTRNVFGGAQDFTTTFKTATIVGAISSPLLAIYNGRTMGMSAARALRALSAKQVTAIAGQEGAFVGGVAGSEPTKELLTDQLGDNIFVVKLSQWVSGAAGSLAGNGANTALTRWQKGLSMTLEDLPRGAWTRMISLGAFNVIYQTATEAMQYFIYK